MSLCQGCGFVNRFRILKPEGTEVLASLHHRSVIRATQHHKRLWREK